MIRKAEFSDIPRLAGLLKQLNDKHIEIAPDSYRAPFFGYYELSVESFLTDDERYTVFTEEQGGVITSYAAVQVIDRERAERVPARILYIEHFVVGEEYRRQGCGRRLFEFLKAYAEESGCSLIQLGAAAQNSDALKFYESMGMKPRSIKMEYRL